jgi:hypothetical protein
MQSKSPPPIYPYCLFIPHNELHIRLNTPQDINRIDKDLGCVRLAGLQQEKFQPPFLFGYFPLEPWSNLSNNFLQWWPQSESPLRPELPRSILGWSTKQNLTIRLAFNHHRPLASNKLACKICERYGLYLVRSYEGHLPLLSAQSSTSPRYVNGCVWSFYGRTLIAHTKSLKARPKAPCRFPRMIITCLIGPSRVIWSKIMSAVTHPEGQPLLPQTSTTNCIASFTRFLHIFHYTENCTLISNIGIWYIQYNNHHYAAQCIDRKTSINTTKWADVQANDNDQPTRSWSKTYHYTEHGEKLLHL